MNGIGILNVGAGDTKLVFDPSKPEEMKKAATIVRDMLRRGYAILVEGEDAYGKTAFVRAHDFDETKCEYIIADTPQPESEDGRVPKKEDGRRTRWRRVPATGTRGVSVGRTAGG